jgi:hypothetical protein
MVDLSLHLFLGIEDRRERSKEGQVGWEKLLILIFHLPGLFELIENGIFESINIRYIVSWVFVFWSEMNVSEDLFLEIYIWVFVVVMLF